MAMLNNQMVDSSGLPLWPCSKTLTTCCAAVHACQSRVWNFQTVKFWGNSLLVGAVRMFLQASIDLHSMTNRPLLQLWQPSKSKVATNSWTLSRIFAAVASRNPKKISRLNSIFVVFPSCFPKKPQHQILSSQWLIVDQLLMIRWN